MAEAILEEEAEAHDIDVRVDSAGTFAIEDSPATVYAVEALESLGIENERHRSKQLNKKLVDWADIILTMEAMHIEEICAMFPQASGKTHTLKGYREGKLGLQSEGYDISDPYGGDLDEYIGCAVQIRSVILGLISEKKL